jgi:SNF2-related domain
MSQKPRGLPIGTLVLDVKHLPKLDTFTETWKELGKECLHLVVQHHEALLQSLLRLCAQGRLYSTVRPFSQPSPHLRLRVYLLTFSTSIRISRKSPKSNTEDSGPQPRHIEQILMALDASPLTWNGEPSTPVPGWVPDHRSLSDIFTDLPGPSPDQSYLAAVKDVGEFMVYPLHSFQQATVAKMLQQETSSGTTPDPTFIPIQSVNSSSDPRMYYLNPSTLEVRESAPTYEMPHGGILCEEMGAGKTAICIALIILTRHRLAVPEASPQARPILTEMSLRYFPSDAEVDARDALGIPHPQTMPSLVEQTLQKLAVDTQRSLLARKDEFDDNWAFGGLTEHLKPFYLHYNDPNTRIRMSARGVIKQTCDLPRKVYLSCATLVVCPLSLYEQWKSELYKFCKEGVLRTLFLADKGHRSMPSARELLKYDVSLESIVYCIKF